MSEEKTKEEILENITCVESLEDQLLKLFCLFNCCMTNAIQNGEELISKRYIREKLGRVIEGVPIILDSKATIMYLAIKLGRYKNSEGTPHLYNQNYEEQK